MKIPIAIDVAHCTTDELLEALRPLTSLISKCEKSQQKLEPGNWQHTMLQNNIKALKFASALMKMEVGDANNFTAENLNEFSRAIALMIRKTEKYQQKFLIGTSQHTLQRNRLKALSRAEATIEMELEKL